MTTIHSTRIIAMASRYNLTLGEAPSLPWEAETAAAWWGRNPFQVHGSANISQQLQIDTNGTPDGHNLVVDTNILETLPVDRWVPLSPLFVKDLAGRSIYIGFGPERKTNDDWLGYGDNGTPVPEGIRISPWAPVCVFPNFCRDVQMMVGKELLEEVFLTKFRSLDMSLQYRGVVSGTGNLEEVEDPDALIGRTYDSANLYPYKLRLDTFYTDGWRLPQTQMLFARGEAQGVDVDHALSLGMALLEAWRSREAGVGYEAWVDTWGGKHEMERLFSLGCTVIPTFEACNGYHVVGRDFSLEDYWPGRSVLGLHEVVERRPDAAPEGTILQVISPGFVTARHIVPAQVIVSDGSAYVSPHRDPAPLLPNLYLPHPRTMAVWGATWVPTHPQHFEAPALWGWESESGRFVQIYGPLWDPLHYYYESVDKVIGAHEAATGRGVPVPVPGDMFNRFYPVIPMRGFDTLSAPTERERQRRKCPLRSAVKRVPTEDYTCGLGYHPLPAEFEFEIEPFWFPDQHPLNRQHGVVPEDLLPRVVPVISPLVGVEQYVESVEAPTTGWWLKDPLILAEPAEEAVENYPHLVRYMSPDIELKDVFNLCPVPFVGELGDLLFVPMEKWWADDEGNPLDAEDDINRFAPLCGAALWRYRDMAVQLVKFRHMLYRDALELYQLGWWFGYSAEQLQNMYAEWAGAKPTVSMTGVATEESVDMGAAAEGAEFIPPAQP